MHYLLIMMLILSAKLFPADGEIFVQVAGVKSAQGTLRIGLYSDADDFLFDPAAYLNIPITNTGTVSGTFKGIPAGAYAISLFQDENDNEKLDLGFLRIPKEPYGFSNNAKATFGPPSFEKASFSHQDGVTIQTIKL